jgi:hypothetical protein
MPRPIAKETVGQADTSDCCSRVTNPDILKFSSSYNPEMDPKCEILDSVNGILSVS